MLTKPDGRPNYLAVPFLGILIVSGLIIVAIVFSLIYILVFTLPEQRQARLAQQREAFQNAPPPIAIAKAKSGGVQIFYPEYIEQLASKHSSNVGIDIEGDAKIEGNIDGIRIVDHHSSILEVDGNITKSSLYLDPGTNLIAHDVSNSQISIPKTGSSTLQDVSGHSAISSEKITIRNATDSTLISKVLVINGKVSPQVKIVKGQWK